MDNSKAVLSLLEGVLGKGNKTSKGNYIFVCPFHVSNPPGKKKLEVNIETDEKGENPYHCWACNARGKTIRSLLKKKKASKTKISEVDMIVKPGTKRKHIPVSEITLPENFISLQSDEELSKLTRVSYRRAKKYLLNRGMTETDIIKYNIGFCKDGFYKDRIIIPSYNSKGDLNYFQARLFDENVLGQKYQNPPVSAKDVIGLELYINWNLPIILCEGMFDAITIKRNVIPLFGKVIHPKLMKKLVKSNVKKIYIALDKDAIKDSLKYCEELLSYGKEVYLVELESKDANTLGFEGFLNILEKTYPLTFSTLLEKKLSII